MHYQAADIMQMVKDETFKEIGRQIKAGKNPKEVEIQHFMHDLMAKNNMNWEEEGPIVAVNEHAADPHFEPTEENSHEIKEGDLVLLDLWAKKDVEGGIYYDITWMGFVGTEVPEKLDKLFKIVTDARDAGLNLVRERYGKGEEIFGWEVDDATRKVIVDAGYGEYFIHRTGHNIAEQVHGNGTHMDNLETKDERCFSIEPGIYMPDKKIGFRSELDVFVTDNGDVEVAGAIQEGIVAIMNLI
jgi:Xaa-Pro aminopeptidase